MDVTVKYGACGRSDPNLVQLKLINFNFFGDPGFPRLIADGRLHDHETYPGSVMLLGTGAVDAARCCGVVFQSSMFDLIAANHAIAKLTLLDTPKRRFNLLKSNSSALVGRDRHGLHLQCVHPRQSSNALLVKRHRLTRIRAGLDSFFQQVTFID